MTQPAPTRHEPGIAPWKRAAAAVPATFLFTVAGAAAVWWLADRLAEPGLTARTARRLRAAPDPATKG